MMIKPIVSEVFADNGEHNHWVLIDPYNGEKVWSEDPDECKAMGYPVKASNSSIQSQIDLLEELKKDIENTNAKFRLKLACMIEELKALLK